MKEEYLTEMRFITIPRCIVGQRIFFNYSCGTLIQARCFSLIEDFLQLQKYKCKAFVAKSKVHIYF